MQPRKVGRNRQDNAILELTCVIWVFSTWASSAVFHHNTAHTMPTKVTTELDNLVVQICICNLSELPRQLFCNSDQQSVSLILVNSTGSSFLPVILTNSSERRSVSIPRACPQRAQGKSIEDHELQGIFRVFSGCFRGLFREFQGIFRMFSGYFSYALFWGVCRVLYPLHPFKRICVSVCVS